MYMKGGRTYRVEMLARPAPDLIPDWGTEVAAFFDITPAGDTALCEWDLADSRLDEIIDYCVFSPPMRGGLPTRFVDEQGRKWVRAQLWKDMRNEARFLAFLAKLEQKEVSHA